MTNRKKNGGKGDPYKYISKIILSLYTKKKVGRCKVNIYIFFMRVVEEINVFFSSFASSKEKESG
jgi:hypothetical protein